MNIYGLPSKNGATAGGGGGGECTTSPTSNHHNTMTTTTSRTTPTAVAAATVENHQNKHLVNGECGERGGQNQTPQDSVNSNQDTKKENISQSPLTVNTTTTTNTNNNSSKLISQKELDLNEIINCTEQEFYPEKSGE
ncbi:unnamed protein product [Trichobilharzia regenti]|nr:unnamed protein product [Trichobilharzia regenti]